MHFVKYVRWILCFYLLLNFQSVHLDEDRHDSDSGDGGNGDSDEDDADNHLNLYTLGKYNDATLRLEDAQGFPSNCAPIILSFPFAMPGAMMPCSSDVRDNREKVSLYRSISLALLNLR